MTLEDSVAVTKTSKGWDIEKENQQLAGAFHQLCIKLRAQGRLDRRFLA